MKIFKSSSGIIIESAGNHFLHKADWDTFVNDDQLSSKLAELTKSLTPIGNADEIISSGILPPIGAQELWACGVTYLRSKVGRQEESQAAGGGDFYARVYEAERPEVFFKSTSHRIVGHSGKVRIRKDSTWDVPEPELTLVVTSSGKIAGYTIGNDMSSRSIEGENPLYLPQAKTYDGCASIGPCIYVTDTPLNSNTHIHLTINRAGQPVFKESIGINQMKRRPEDLVHYVYRECSFPHGCLIMTGTGIVPPQTFTLRSGDEIQIKIDPIGKLVNTVA